MNAICRRSTSYTVQRFNVPDDKVPWNIPWPDYDPPNFTAPYLSTFPALPWADPEIDCEKFHPKWNEVDGDIDRRSFDQNEQVKYDIINGYPLNRKGRTGLRGRGRLGRWGPNHAADGIMTRWKRSNGAKILNGNGLPILQFLSILRKDCKQWAIPGGFVDPKEVSDAAVLREVFEEAINLTKLSDEAQKALTGFFSSGKQVYRGYVDDPRNTDNAWIETTAFNFHDDVGKDTDMLVLDARDDAADVKWTDIDYDDTSIYPTHLDIIKSVNEIHNKSS